MNQMAKKKKRERDKREPVTESQLRDAVSVITREYYEDVRGIGDDLIDQIQDGDIARSDDFGDALHDAVDGTQRVIYTWQARLGLIASENHDAYFEEGIGDLDCSESVPYETLMFYALQKDVVEYMDREGFDPYDRDTYAEDDEDEDDED
jgi:hypothetical protein